MTYARSIALGAALATVLALGGCSPAAGEPPADSTADVRDVFDRWAKAFKAKDIDGIMALYAPGDALLAYDLVAPLQYRGKDAYKKDYEEFLGQYSSPIEVEYRDLRVVAGNDVAFLYALERIGGTLKNGQRSDVWLRATSGLRKIEGKWLIVHDHISVPADLATGKALLELKPAGGPS